MWGRVLGIVVLVGLSTPAVAEQKSTEVEVGYAIWGDDYDEAAWGGPRIGLTHHMGRLGISLEAERVGNDHYGEMTALGAGVRATLMEGRSTAHPEQAFRLWLEAGIGIERWKLESWFSDDLRASARIKRRRAHLAVGATHEFHERFGWTFWLRRLYAAEPPQPFMELASGSLAVPDGRNLEFGIGLVASF